MIFTETQSPYAASILRTYVEAMDFPAVLYATLYIVHVC